MMDGGVKRKSPVKKKLFMLTNSTDGKKAAALFELKITIGLDDGQLAVDPHYEPDQELKSTETFYDQRWLPSIATVAACVSGSNLYLIPHDEEKPSFNDNPLYPPDDDKSKEYDTFAPNHKITLQPCSFGLNQNKSKPVWLHIPQARKFFPILTVIGNSLFALSTLCPCDTVPKPCFESLNLDDEIWIALECPPFHENPCPDLFIEYDSVVTGFVVLEDRSILVSVVKHKTAASYYSYNVQSKTWSPVQIIHENDENSTIMRTWIHEDAVVVGNDIYTFDCDYKELFVFSYTVDVTTSLPSVTSFRKVQSLEFKKDDPCLLKDYDSYFMRTGTIAKVDDQILCIVYAMFTGSWDVQNVCVAFIEVLGAGNCKMLNSFTCNLLNGTDNSEQAIKYCYLMDDLEEKVDQRSGKRANNADDKAPMESECGGGTGETEAAEVKVM